MCYVHEYFVQDTISKLYSKLEDFENTFKEEIVFYEYVDGEEGDTFKKNYYHESNLVGSVENHGGDYFEEELTEYGETLILSFIIEQLKLKLENK